MSNGKSNDARGPAYRIETERLVVRCSEPADAQVLTDAIVAEREWLRPWLPWADAPLDLAGQCERLRGVRADFDANRDQGFLVFARAAGDLVGGAGLHRRGPDHEREIGYWVRAGAVGRGLCSEFTAALVRVAFEVERVHRIQICCDPDNAASNRVPAKLGFQREGCQRERLEFPDGRYGDTVIWGLLRPEFDGSACGRLAAGIRAWNAAGDALL